MPLLSLGETHLYDVISIRSHVGKVMVHHTHMVTNLVHGQEIIWVKVANICSVHQPRFGVGKFVFFLPLHSTVLEPDFDLSL